MQSGVKISKKKARELSISLSTRLHGEVFLDELVILANSINSNNGYIDTKLLKSADHALPTGHINPGNASAAVQTRKLKEPATVKMNNGDVSTCGEANIKRAPSCEFLDQIGDMSSSVLLYSLDDYAKLLYERLEKLEIDEENKVGRERESKK